MHEDGGQRQREAAGEAKEHDGFGKKERFSSPKRAILKPRSRLGSPQRGLSKPQRLQ
jgi:hypothetical protein